MAIANTYRIIEFQVKSYYYAYTYLYELEAVWKYQRDIMFSEPSR